MTNPQRRPTFFNLAPWIASLGSFVFILALPSHARAAAGSWTAFGPGGGTVFSLAVDPNDPATVYATSGTFDGFPGTLYRSRDRGQTWKTLVGTGFSLVALAPESSSTIYAGGFNLARSTDGGETWSDISPPSDLIFDQTALAVAPGNVILVAGDSFSTPAAVVRSADGGQTWSVVSPETNVVHSIVIDPTDPSRVYYTSNADVLKSTDGGQSWTRLSRLGGPTISLEALAVAPSSPQTLYAASTPNVFRSDDGGATWRQVGAPSPVLSVFQAIVVDPRSRDHVLVASWEGFFSSTDGGVTWRKTMAGLPRPVHQTMNLLAVAQAPSQPDIVYTGTLDWGVAWSGSAGAHWRIGVEPGLNGGSVELLRFHPLQPDTVYVGLGTNLGLGSRSFRSTDEGRSWQQFARAISQDGLYDLAFDATDPRTLYAATSDGLLKSLDGGGAWKKVSGMSASRLATLGPGVLLAGSCGARRSTDGGRTWIQVVGCDEGSGHVRNVRELWTDAASPGPFYASFNLASEIGAGGLEVFRSWDGGARWQRLLVPDRLLALFAAAPSAPKVLYGYGNLTGLHRSADAGDSWQLVHGPVSQDLRLADAMVVDTADADTLYISTYQGTLVSRDGGKTLALSGAPFESGKQAASRMWTVRTRPGRVYAAAVDGGLFEGRFEP